MVYDVNTLNVISDDDNYINITTNVSSNCTIFQIYYEDILQKNKMSLQEDKRYDD